MSIILIAAFDQERGLGKDNQLLFHLKEDLKRFRALTTGHTVVMGRKTFESLPYPLPERRNVILTRNTRYKHSGCEVVTSPDDILAKYRADDRIFIIGGAQIYEQFLPYATDLYLTQVFRKFEADAFFPVIPEHRFKTRRQELLRDGKTHLDFMISHLVRIE